MSTMEMYLIRWKLHLHCPPLSAGSGLDLEVGFAGHEGKER